MSWIEINCLSTPESALPLDNSNLQYLTAAMSLYQIMHTCMQIPILIPRYVCPHVQGCICRPCWTPPRTDSYTNSAPTRLKKMRLRDGSPPSVQGTSIPCYKDGSKEKQETLAHSLFPCSLYVHSWSELSPPS